LRSCISSIALLARHFLKHAIDCADMEVHTVRFTLK